MIPLLILLLYLIVVSEVFASVQVKVWSWIYTKSRSAYFPYSSWVLNSLACMRLIH